MTRPAARLAAATLLIASACASARAERARRQALAPPLDALRYSKPLDEVWNEARRLLAEKGYQLDDADARAAGQKPNVLSVLTRSKDTRPDPAGGQFLETEWGPGPFRYRLQGSSDASGTRIVLWAIPENSMDPGHDGYPPIRGLDLELELARRLDPAAAAAIEAALPAGAGVVSPGP